MICPGAGGFIGLDALQHRGDVRADVRIDLAVFDLAAAVEKRRGLLVHAETPEARAFYLHLIPEFEQSPTDDLHLVLLMKDILKTLAG